ncbi:MAG: hypothetical protein QOG54_1724 [Actinomycetota bacterium]|jgi:hypothetical protein|nr:hypothetical protein [Actinomycetota bacterium]
MTPDFGLGNPASLMVNGCFPDETSRKLALRCLRFDSRVGNDGDGPLEVEYRQAGAGFTAFQRIHLSDGSIDEREAAPTSYHPTHTHFHIDGFYVARLWEAGRKGPKRSRPPVAVGDKSGFCPEDSYQMSGDGGESTYSCFGLNGEAHVPTSFVGISAGWMDVYGAHLPDQFIEISDVTDGRYVLEIEIDPNNVFVESDETNNRECSLLELTGTQVRMLDIDVPCLKGA